MATWAQITRTVDRVAPDVLAELAAFQDAYYSDNGHYWQGVWTSDTPPVDGENVQMNIDVHPWDQLDTWRDKNMSSRLLPVRVAVDVEEGGYTLRASIMWGGVERVKAWGVGLPGYDWIDCPENP